MCNTYIHQQAVAGNFTTAQYCNGWSASIPSNPSWNFTKCGFYGLCVSARLCHCLPSWNVLLCSVHCSNSCVQNLPNASDIQALATNSTNQLVAPIQQLRLFPNIRFTCNGSIVGWRLAAIDHTRNGRPELSVWRPRGVNQFAKVAGRRIDSCTVSESMRTLGASTVMIHENILNSPIAVEAGDVLGIHFIAGSGASYIPLLYNVTGSGGLVSYYRTARGSPPGDVFTLTGNSVAQDTLFPLISLEICLQYTLSP